MDSIFIDASKYNSTFSANHPPVVEVEPGAIVTFETSGSCYERIASGIDRRDIDDVNLVTGPVFVKGAQSGDALRIDILDIDICRAWVVRLPGLAGAQNQTRITAKELEIRDNCVGFGNAWVDIDPMVGCIGVAPKKGIGSTLAPAGRWGGNMDLRELRRGASILLPVFHSGGLLSLGDIHAAMGQGEPCIAGIESSGVVTVRISIIPHSDLTGPRLLVPGATICIGMGNTLEQARHSAIRQGLQVLGESFDIENWDAWIYASGLMELSLGGPASPIVLCRVASR